MSERKELGGISVVTDCDTDMERPGEVGGGFNRNELYDHITRYGSTELLKTLNYMIADVIRVEREINNRSYSQGETKAVG